MNSAELLTGFERCGRIPWWGKDWKPGKLKAAEFVAAGVRAGLTESVRQDYGELAGETIYGMGSDPGLDSKEYNLHDEVVHLAALGDVIVSAIRKAGSPPWTPAPDLPNWRSGCFISPDGAKLRRLTLVTSWDDNRHYATCRSWECLGEVCHFNLPLQMVVIVLGAHRDGRFHSYWSHGLRHPSGNKTIRFRRRNKIGEGFKETWREIWRQDFDDISTHDWLEGMLQDGVLQDLCRRVDIAVPSKEQRERIVDLAQRKLAIINATKELPMQNLSTCDWPSPCFLRSPCHALQEPSPAYGFVRIQQ